MPFLFYYLQNDNKGSNILLPTSVSDSEWQFDSLIVVLLSSQQLEGHELDPWNMDLCTGQHMGLVLQVVDIWNNK